VVHKSFTGSAALALLERALRGRDDAFFDLLQASAENAAEAAEQLKLLLQSYPDGHDAAQHIHELERAGDEITHEIVQRLNKEVATPIDRKDILELAGVLDDITDYINEVADYLTLYKVEASFLQANAMADVLVDATRQLTFAVQKAVRFESIREHAHEVHRLENEGDRLVRRAIAALFIDGIDPLVVIRWKDIFERLEDAIDSTERAAFVLESVVIKNI
jgi:predicted phosphate transport protein (TIGR00153 family)